MSGSTLHAAATSIDEALQRAGRAAPAPVAGGTDLVVGARSGKAPLPEAPGGDPPARRAARHQRARTAACRSARWSPTPTSRRRGDPASATRRWPTRRPSSASHATRHAGTHRRQRHERLAGDGDRRPADLLRARSSTLRSATGERAAGGGRAVHRPRTGPSPTPDELLTAVELPRPAAGTGSCYARLEYRRQMEIAIVGATAVVTLDGGDLATPAIAITALAPTIHRVPEAEAALIGTDGGAAGRAGGGRRRRGGVQADLRRARLGRLPPRDGRGDHTPRDRRRDRTRPRRAVPDPRQPRAPRRDRRRSSMRYAATLHVNGNAYPVEIEPGRTLLSVLRTELGLTGAKEGCDDSECGACMVLIDGQPVNSCSYLALQADGPRDHHRSRAWPRRRRAAPAAAGVSRPGRRPVRLLHAGHADLGQGAARPHAEARARRRSGWRCRATSAAAPATRASCERFRRRPSSSRCACPAPPPATPPRPRRRAPRAARRSG